MGLLGGVVDTVQDVGESVVGGAQDAIGATTDAIGTATGLQDQIGDLLPGRLGQVAGSVTGLPNLIGGGIEEIGDVVSGEQSISGAAGDFLRDEVSDSTMGLVGSGGGATRPRSSRRIPPAEMQAFQRWARRHPRAARAFKQRLSS